MVSPTELNLAGAADVNISAALVRGLFHSIWDYFSLRGRPYEILNEYIGVDCCYCPASKLNIQYNRVHSCRQQSITSYHIIYIYIYIFQSQFTYINTTTFYCTDTLIRRLPSVLYSEV